MTARKTAADFDPKVLELYDGYVHGKITKRAFLEGAAKYAAAGVSAAALLESLRPNYALAQQVAPDDPDITTGRVTYQSPDGHGEIAALMAHPAAAEGPRAGVLVIHENRGLNPYIEDVARRLAKAGYVALAPDGLSPLGGYPGSDEEGREMQRELDGGKLLADFFAAYEFLRDHPDTTDRTGAVGFCYGGGVVNALAVAYGDLDAGVPFYGRQAAADDVPAIEAPLLLHYAELDERINEGWPDYKAALDEHGKEYEAVIHAGVQHGFHNDTTPRFDAEAADRAWQMTLEFFDKHLGA